MLLKEAAAASLSGWHTTHNPVGPSGPVQYNMQWERVETEHRPLRKTRLEGTSEVGSERMTLPLAWNRESRRIM